MIRVITADELASTTITVDGKLSGDYVDPVETCCKQADLKRETGAALPARRLHDRRAGLDAASGTRQYRRGAEGPGYLQLLCRGRDPIRPPGTAAFSPVTPPAEIGTCHVR